MTSSLDRNLQALRDREYPVPDAPEMPAGWQLDTSNGEIHLSVPGPGGRLVAAHSRRHPLVEAERLVAAHDPAQDHAVAIAAGAGLGFAVDVLASLRSDRPVIVVELEFDRLLPFLSRRDWSREISEGRLGVFWPGTTTGAHGLRRLLEARDGSQLVVPHPVVVRSHGPELSEALAAFRQFWHGARANRAARLAFEGPYAENTLINASRLDGLVDIRHLAGIDAGRAIAVTAAGPSLDAQLDDLRMVRSSITLVSVDTALRPLLAAGLDPDFVVAVDPSALNATHLTDLATRTRAWLVSELSLPPVVFDAFSPRLIPFRVARNQPWPWLIEHDIDLGILAAWGSVLVTAIDFACHLGGSPILLCGADLAYTGGRPYCRGTTFERSAAAGGESGEAWAQRWHTLVAENLVTIEDLDGQPTQALAHFPDVRDGIIELAARRSGHQIVNTTGAGILTGGSIIQGTLRGSVEAKTVSTAGRQNNDWTRHERLTSGILGGQQQQALDWDALTLSVRWGWPHLGDGQISAAMAALRSLSLAGTRPGNGLAVAEEACLRWLTPLFDAAWTTETQTGMASLGAAIPHWFEWLEPLFSPALDEARVEPGTYTRMALWATRTAGDALYLDPARGLTRRAVDRLLAASASGLLDLDTEADLALLMLCDRGRVAAAADIITRVFDRLTERSLVTEALQALSLRERADTLLAGQARLSPDVVTLARTWADLDLRTGRDTALTFRHLVHLAACSGQTELARQLLREGLVKHPLLANSCAVLALEAWLSHEPAFARLLLHETSDLEASTPTLAFQMAAAHALLGDSARAGDLLSGLQAMSPRFFCFTGSPNSRWFYMARTARALNDKPLAERVATTMRCWDPLAHQRESVAPLTDASRERRNLPAFDLPPDVDARRVSEPATPIR
jgi:hypothetical protein